MKIDSMKAQLSRINRQKRTLERQIQTLEQKKLTELPREIGFEDVDSLINALIRYASHSLRAKLHAIGVGIDEVPVVHQNGGNGRARFSEELKTRIREELESGRKSVAELAREYGPSHPTIMGWKREWGLTRPRAKRSSAAK